MDNIKIKNEIREILNKLDGMPYGIETHHKTLPPNVYHYKMLIDRLIDSLSQMESENVYGIISEICSIRDNEARVLFLNNTKSFENLGFNQEMEDITRKIHLIVDRLFI